MEKRNELLDRANSETRERLTRIETRLDNFATRADLHAELHVVTWKFITWTTSIGTALIAATFAITKFS